MSGLLIASPSPTVLAGDVGVLADTVSGTNTDTKARWPNLGTGNRILVVNQTNTGSYGGYSFPMSPGDVHAAGSSWIAHGWRRQSPFTSEPFVLAADPEVVVSWVCDTLAVTGILHAQVAAIYPDGTGVRVGVGSSGSFVFSTSGSQRSISIPRDNPGHVYPAGTVLQIMLMAQVTVGGANVSGVTGSLRIGSSTFMNVPAWSARAARTATDVSPALADLARRATSLFRRPTDALAAPGDAASRVFSAGRATSEAVPALADTPVRSATLNQDADISISTPVDAAERQVTFDRVPQDGGLPTDDSAVRLATATRGADDAFSLGDAAERLYTAGRTTRYAFQPGDEPLIDPVKDICGVVRDGEGNPYTGGATVVLFRSDTGVAVQTTTSAADGSYSFPRNSYDSHRYFVAAWAEEGGVAPIQAVTERDLVPS